MYHGSAYCEWHYNDGNITGYAPKTPEKWFRHNLLCFGPNINEKDYSKQKCDCQF
jgi:hypothetical protein